jgi:hypothetical protein
MKIYLFKEGSFVCSALQGRDIVLRIIIEYSSFKGFYPFKIRWDDSS